MVKIALIVIGLLIAVMVLLAWPFVKEATQSARQRQELQSRTDYAQIAAACVPLAKGATNDPTLISPADPRVSALLRSLGPRSIAAWTNFVTLEFHGGFDHYGYRIRQSANDAKQWTISYYTEKSERVLTTISSE